MFVTVAAFFLSSASLKRAFVSSLGLIPEGPPTNLGSQLLGSVGRLTSAVSVISTRHNTIRHGITVTSVTSVSMNPPSLLFCINRAASLHDPVIRSGRWFGLAMTLFAMVVAPLLAAELAAMDLDLLVAAALVQRSLKARREAVERFREGAQEGGRKCGPGSSGSATHPAPPVRVPCRSHGRIRPRSPSRS